MQSLAYFASSKGLRVGGSDLSLSAKQKEAFQKYKIVLHSQDEIESLEGYDAFVFSSAIPENHPQRKYADSQASLKNIALLHRMDFLNLCMQESAHSFAIAGTHGKSSSTAMMAWLFLQWGLKPHLILGARPLFLEQSFYLGSGELGLYESDESDGSFLKSRADLRLVLNIDEDHLEHYGTMDRLKEAFETFCKEGKLLALNVNDPILREIGRKPQIAARSVFFSFWETKEEMQEYLQTEGGRGLAHYTGYLGERNEAKKDTGIPASSPIELFVFRASQKEKAPLLLGQLELKLLPGLHFVGNALGVLALALEARERGFLPKLPASPSFSRSIEIMRHFPGLERRLEYLGKFQGARVYDDYAHHPTEIEAALEGLQKLQPETGRQGRLIAIFQPHRYSRTAKLYASLARALSHADTILLLPLYSAGEKPLDGISAELIYKSMDKDQVPCFLLEKEEVIEALVGLKLQAEDLILALGAGNISQILRKNLEKRKDFVPLRKAQGLRRNWRL